MNERIRELYNQCFVVLENHTPNTGFDFEKFAELIVRECAYALNPMLRDMISRGQGVHMIYKHFGMEE